jgi:hypothetical protein
MFGLADLLREIDLESVFSKVDLGEDNKVEVKKQAAAAVNYRTQKEKKRGNDAFIENLFSSHENKREAVKIQKKIEEDLEYNLKTKSNIDFGIIDKIKEDIISKFLSEASAAAKESGDEEGKGLSGLFGGNDIMKNIANNDLKETLKSLF